MLRTLAVLLAVLSASAEGQPHLVFDGKIGSEWSDNNRWMNFVAISAVHYKLNLEPMEQSSNRPRVVIAEDFVLIQEGIRLALEKDCDIVALVEDGEAALEAVATLHPDILLLDVSLPKLRGFLVVERLTQAGSPTKIIFVTSYSDKNYVDRAFEIGVKGYVLKGSIQTELLTAIRAVIGGGLYRSPLLP